jgi:hypothetical protein
LDENWNADIRDGLEEFTDPATKEKNLRSYKR